MRPFSRAVRLLVCALAVAPWALAQVFPPFQPDPLDNVGVADALSLRPPRSVETGVTVFQGSYVHYEVIDGLAVAGGDMIIGAAEEVAARSIGSNPAKRGGPSPRQLAPVADDRLWPRGIIPYVIDEELPEEQKQFAREAIEIWNTQTVITLVPRTFHRTYLRFKYDPDFRLCAAEVGRNVQHGESVIFARRCGRSAFLHEIGHAVGLNHEHQREDRDRYVTLPMENITRSGRIYSLWGNFFPGKDSYNYRSIMHYPPLLLPTVNSPRYLVRVGSIPPGMPIGWETVLTPGDIHGVAHLYGMSPKATVISTNPPGLDIIVDGERVATPASFEWEIGSEHVLEAPSPQSGGDNTRYLFGRWSDEGRRRHTIQAGRGNTWFEANFILQHRATTHVSPPGAGSVVIRPESPDGFYTRDMQVSVKAEPSPGSDYRFESWGHHHWWGWSENPIPPSHRFPVEKPETLFYPARFSESPLFLIDSNVERFAVYLDDKWMMAPVAVRPRSGRPVIRMEELQYPSLGFGRRRLRFQGWSDGGDIAHAIEMPPEGGVLTAEVIAEYLLDPKAQGFGEVKVSSPSDDGFYPSGSQVTLTAVPSDRWSLSHWRGGELLFDPVRTVVMNSPLEPEAVFTSARKIRPSERVTVRLRGYPSTFHIYNGSDAYFVQVPPEASELTVNFRTLSRSRDHDLLLLVRRGQGVLIETGPGASNTREDVVARADYAFALSGRNESFTITRASDPPLEAGVYYLVPATFDQSHLINGRLTADITLGGAPPPTLVADPLAFTLVALFGGDAPAQPLRIANEGGSTLNYRIDSDLSALSASPPQGSIPAGDTAELDIVAHAAGLLPDTYSGELSIVEQEASDSSEADDSAKLLSLPVTLVVLSPPDDEE